MGKEKLAKALSGEGKPMTTTMYCIVFMTVQFFAVPCCGAYRACQEA